MTATREPRDLGPTRTLYRLSEPTTSEGHPDQFEYVTLSRGRDGDTCAFPADAAGRIQDFVGFGFGMGPSRWLDDSEFDEYMAECIAQHEEDHGTGASIYHEGVTA